MIDFLKSCFETNGVGSETMQAVADLCETVSFEANEIIYRADEASDYLYLVKSGQVDVQYLLTTGCRMTVDSLHPGDVLVWSAVVGPHTTSSIGIARPRTELIRIPGDKLRALCEKDKDFGYRLMHHMAKVIRRRLQAARQQIADML